MAICQVRSVSHTCCVARQSHAERYLRRIPRSPSIPGHHPHPRHKSPHRRPITVCTGDLSWQSSLTRRSATTPRALPRPRAKPAAWNSTSWPIRSPPTATCARRTPPTRRHAACAAPNSCLRGQRRVLNWFRNFTRGKRIRSALGGHGFRFLRGRYEFAKIAIASHKSRGKNANQLSVQRRHTNPCQHNHTPLTKSPCLRVSVRKRP